MTGKLAGRVAIVTGAASGIGAASARLFASEGARVIAVDLPGRDRAKAVEGLLPGSGRIVFMPADVAERSQMEDVVQNVSQSEGRVDVLFCNAGFNLVKSLEETDDSDIETCLAVNLRAIIQTCRAVLPIMRRQHSGVILSTASSAGLVGRPALPVYSAAKAGVVVLTKSLALATGGDGVRVNCICPGSIQTPMLEQSLGQLSDPDAAFRRVAETCCLNKLGDPEDIANAALFLASDDAKFITGVALPVDGGRSAGVQEASGVFDALAVWPAGAAADRGTA